MQLQFIGTARDNQQWRQQLLAQNLVLRGPMLIKLFDLCLTLMYLGIPKKLHVWRQPGSGYQCHHPDLNTLKEIPPCCLHRVQEAIAAGYLQFHWKDRKSSPTDILSKDWGFTSIWPLLQTLLFWRGDTSEFSMKSNGSDRFPINMTTKEGSWFDLKPSSCVEKGVLKVVPDFTPNPTILSAKLIRGALPTLFHIPITQIYCYCPILEEHLSH